MHSHNLYIPNCDKVYIPRSKYIWFRQSYAIMGAENYNLLNSLPLENFILLGSYAQSSGNSIRTFRDNLSFPSSEVKFTYNSHLQRTSWPLKTATICCPETSVRNYHYSLRNSLEERSSHLLHGGSLNSRVLLLISRRQNLGFFLMLPK